MRAGSDPNSLSGRVAIGAILGFVRRQAFTDRRQPEFRRLRRADRRQRECFGRHCHARQPAMIVGEVEPGAIGMGLNLADYHRWLPGVAMSPEAFALPAICTAKATEFGLPPVGEGLPPDKTENCSDCHTTR